MSETNGDVTKTEDGHYKVAQPILGYKPERVSLTVDGTTYTFSGLVGTASESRVHPDVLLYEDVTVTAVDVTDNSADDTDE